MKPNEQALLSPLSLLVWGDEAAADGGSLGAGTRASGCFSAVKTELKSSVVAAQFLALVLGWNWAETLVLGAISAKLCLDLKLTWAVLSAVRSQEENSFSSRDGPRGVDEEQASLTHTLATMQTSRFYYWGWISKKTKHASVGLCKDLKTCAWHMTCEIKLSQAWAVTKGSQSWFTPSGGNSPPQKHSQY